MEEGRKNTREKILAVLREAGHGLTINTLYRRVYGIHDEAPIWPMNNLSFYGELLRMESDKLVFLHRADGSAGTKKNEIVLVTLRKHD